MSVGIVLFTRDLRLRDNPTLVAALHRHDRVVPLFVLDDAILRSRYNSANRAAFLADALHDLHGQLAARGGALVVRRGATHTEVARLARQVHADAVHVSTDASGYARRRAVRLREALEDVELAEHDTTLFVVEPGRIRPSGSGDHMAVFAAFYRRWLDEDRRAVLRAPASIHQPVVRAGRVPTRTDISPGAVSPELPRGGESAARELLARWLREDASDYVDKHDALADDATSRLSPYLHFGCLSPLDLVQRSAVTKEFVRQVCWRDFHAQVLAARPASTTRDYRPRGDRWRRSRKDFDAWREGRTGLPLVDAGMRQLLREGWMHNRARLIVAHVLTKTLYLDWRWGAQHFVDLLVDGDVANNTMNWQWVAGTGTDSRFNRTYNVTTQAKKYDPDGDYVRRYVTELRGIDGFAVHEPWKLAAAQRRNYPDPIVDVAEGNRRFLAARGK